ncbi:hypothetical protein L218DRAFT_903762 [Marasmius fiardii PR-910]|nr:hypothetical protein L218DRAFT_903762 [Marasmius fiardii PR-910]
MPPIPNTFDEDALKIISTSERLEHDISDFQIPRLRDFKGTLSAQQQLATEIRDDIEKLSRQVEELDILVDDQRGEKNRRELRRIVEEKREQLNRLRRDSRAALLASKHTIDSMSLSNREELLRSSAVKEQTKASGNASEDALMDANKKVTESLRRVVGVMQGELERSVLSVQMLESSTKTLQATSTAHDTLTFTMDTSKTLITALVKADWQDRALIIAGFVFFMTVVLFVVKERVLDRGLRIAFWWTRFIPDFGGDEELLRAGMKEAASVTASMASVASSLAGVVTSSSMPTPASLETELSDSSEATLSEILTIALVSESSSIASLPTESSFNMAEGTVSSSSDDLTHEEL